MEGENERNQGETGHFLFATSVSKAHTVGNLWASFQLDGVLAAPS
jgi:hypothetical protein